MERNKKNLIIIKACCVIAAFALWLYISNAENSVIQRDVKNVKVKLINTDALQQFQLVELPKSEYTVTLKITGPASDVNAVVNKPEDFNLVADMSKYAVKNGENTIPVTVEGKPNNINVLANYNLYVTVDLDELEEKTVPLKAIVEGKIKTGYFASEPVVFPSDVMISGPKKYVDKVTAVAVKPDISGVDKDVSLYLPLVAVDSSNNVVEGVTILKDYGEVSISVKKVKTVGINLVTKGKLSSDLILNGTTVQPDKVDIAGTDDAVNSIDSLNTETLDLSKITPEMIQNGFVVVKIIVPSNIKLINSDGTVIVKLNTSKIIQRTFNLTIQYKNLSAQFTATPNITTITLVVSGEESVINQLKDTDLSAYIDFTSAVEGNNNLPIVLGALPNGVNKVSVSADHVTISLAKKQ